MKCERRVFRQSRVLPGERVDHIVSDDLPCWLILREQHLALDICDSIGDFDTLLKSVYVQFEH